MLAESWPDDESGLNTFRIVIGLPWSSKVRILPTVITPELAIIVPTFNERENIRPLIGLVEAAMGRTVWELLVVDDDSPDGTASLVREIAREDPRVRCIQRIGRRGLSSACIEGFLATSAPFVAVMDADLQHDERLLPEMLKALHDQSLDLAVASRYIAGGDAESGLADGWRRWASRAATAVGNWVMKTQVSDPMSGFFMFRRATLEPFFPRLSGSGFKILLDLLATADRPLKVEELPYRMRTRTHGESKLDSLVIGEYLFQVAEKLVGDRVPLRFLLFVAVGATGVGVHALTLYLAFLVGRMEFLWGQSLATLVAMTSNFLLNNIFTYRDQRLHGRGLLRGLLSFYFACSIGAVINIEVADLLFEGGIPWLGAGLLGAMVGAVWNYALTAHFTWGRKPRRAA